MPEHLLIESEGPAYGPGATRFVTDAAHLVRAGGTTALLLVDNAVFAALPGACDEVADFTGSGGELLVDAYAFHQRALAPDHLLPGARLVEMDEVAALLLEHGTRVVWH
ncbi:hypothetical protein ACFWIA_02555 [Streptomyces sp. NPDC127068]|uniref:hypothetical protein n=1 Tax=Streptomyces sp. NPDC127068 TaxID=3347127 RepID=UPI00364F689C